MTTPGRHALIVAVLVFATASPAVAWQVDSLLHPVDDANDVRVLEDLLEDATDRREMRGTRLSWTSAFSWRRRDGTRARTRLDVSTAHWQGRVDASRDPGEPWLPRGEGPLRLPDPIGAYITWRPLGAVRVLAGDFRIEHGVALAAGRPTFGRFVDRAFAGSRTGPTGRPSGVVRPYAGVDRRRHYSGVALGIGTAAATIDLLATAPDDSGIATRGTSVVFGRHGISGSALLLEERSARPTAFPSRTAADTFRVRRTAALHVRGWTGRVGWSAEVARVGSRDAVAVFARARGKRLDGLAGWRRMPPGYAPRWASGPSFRGGSPGNETGFVAALQRRNARGPYRVTWDRGCRIVAEASYSRGGCSDALRADSRWVAGTTSLDVRISHEWRRDEDSAERRGSMAARFGISATLALPLAAAAVATLSVANRVDGADGPDARSSRASVRIAWEPTPAWRILVGASDVHAERSALAVYEGGLPLTSSIRTVGGDDTSIFLSAVWTARHGSIGILHTLHRNLVGSPGPDDEARTDASFSVFVALDLGPTGRR